MFKKSYVRTSQMGLAVVVLCAAMNAASAPDDCRNHWYFEDFSEYLSTSDPDFLNNWQGYWTESITGGISAITTLVSNGLRLENTDNPYWAGMKRDICDTDETYLFDVVVTPSNTSNHFVLGIRKFGPSSTSYQIAVTFKNGTIYAEDNGVDVAVGNYAANQTYYLSAKRYRNSNEWDLRVNQQYVGVFQTAYSGNNGRHVVFYDHGGYSGYATIHSLTWLPVVGTGF